MALISAFDVLRPAMLVETSKTPVDSSHSISDLIRAFREALPRALIVTVPESALAVALSCVPDPLRFQDVDARDTTVVDAGKVSTLPTAS